MSEGYSRLVMHIPHTSTAIPDDVRADIILSNEQLKSELLWMTDRYTDELYGIPHERIGIVGHPVSRLVLDPERFEDDEEEPMSKVGMGVVYTKTSLGEPLRKIECAVSRERLLERYYHPHHQRLETAVDAGLNHGEVLIVDGHSYPLRVRPFERNQSGPRGEICIGTDEFHTPGHVFDQLERHFTARGYSVSKDSPFLGRLCR